MNPLFAKGRGKDYLTARMPSEADPEGELFLSNQSDDAATDLLIKEVDEDLRHEQLQQLWKKYGSLFSAAGLAVVLAVAGWQGWNAWDLKQRKQASAGYAEALAQLEQGKKDEAAESLSTLIATAPKGYAALALLRLAEMKQAQGDNAGAVALYGRVAANSGLDKVYRDMATLRAAYLQLDSGDPSQLEKTLEPLAVESSAWRHSAREILALLSLRRGDAAKAGELFSTIAEDAAAPQSLRARATEMLAASGQGSRS